MSTLSGCSDGAFLLTIVQLSSYTSSEPRRKTFFPFLFSRMNLEAGLLPFQEKASLCAKKEESPKLWYLQLVREKIK